MVAAAPPFFLLYTPLSLLCMALGEAAEGDEDDTEEADEDDADVVVDESV